MKSFLRISASILLMMSVIPPLSVGVMNIFVLFPAILGLFLLCLPAIRALVRRLGERREKALIRLFWAAVAITVAVSGTEFILIRQNAVPREAPEKAVVIVLGAQVRDSRPTLILEGRIRAAAEYLSAHPGSLCIASGGRGPDEDISEAKCIRNTLVERYGIDPERIFLEDKSYNTAQNLSNCAEIISGKGLSEDVVLVTDGFHMFRAGLIAGRVGLHPFTCPAVTDPRLLLYLYIREFVAIPKTFLFDR